MVLKPVTHNHMSGHVEVLILIFLHSNPKMSLKGLRTNPPKIFPHRKDRIPNHYSKVNLGDPEDPTVFRRYTKNRQRLSLCLLPPGFLKGYLCAGRRRAL